MRPQLPLLCLLMAHPHQHRYLKLPPEDHSSHLQNKLFPPLNPHLFLLALDLLPCCITTPFESSYLSPYILSFLRKGIILYFYLGKLHTLQTRYNLNFKT